MRDNIKGALKTILQPGDTKVGVNIRVKPCSSATANDGYIPFDTTVSLATVTIYDEALTDVTTDILLAGPTVSGGEYVRVDLKYPDTYGDGNYKADFLLTRSDGGTRKLVFDRIVAATL